MTSLRRLKFAAVFLPVAVFVLWGLASWHLAQESAVREARLKADLVREYVLRVLEGQRGLLAEAAGIVGAADLSELAREDRRALDARLAGLRDRLEYTVSVAAVSEAGRVVAATREDPADLDVSMREFFRERSRIGELPHISRISLRPEGTDAVVLARRQEGGAGLVVAGTRVEAFTSFFSQIADHPLDAASIIRGDGTILVRHEPSWPAIRLARDQPFMREIARADRGVYEVRAVSDDVRRTYAFERVGAYPLYASYGVARQAVLVPWLQRMALAAVVLAFLGALAYALVRQTQRRLVAERERVRADFDARLLAEAREAAERNRLLLEEAHHRIKNSLQIVSSFISLGRKDRSDPDTLLLKVAERVRAISAVHDLLYENNMSGREIDLVAVIDRVLKSPGLTPTDREIAIRFSPKVDGALIPASTAVSIVLVVVELVINAGKHAFADRKGGTIGVVLDVTDEAIAVAVADDGVGLPDADGDARSSGLKLVNALLRQIGGELVRESGPDGGARITLVVPRTA